MRGESLSRGLAMGTTLTRGQSKGRALTIGTVLAPVREKQLEYYGAAALMRRQERLKAEGQLEILFTGGRSSIDLDVALSHGKLMELDSKRARIKGAPKLKRAMSDKVVKRHLGAKPVLERSPIDPPQKPEKDTSADLPTPGTSRYAFFAAAVEWLVSPAQDVSMAKQEVSAWPREANRGEPGEKQLDQQMAAVLEIIERANFGTFDSSAGAPAGNAHTKSMVDLGYSVRLCLHQHREARTFSSRAAQIRQRDSLK